LIQKPHYTTRKIIQLKHDYSISSLLVSGFQEKGANWKDQQLYYFSKPTGIRYQGDGGRYRVVWPNGTLSADYYNLARVKQHCRDIARAIYPRQRPAPSTRSDGDIAGASDCDVAGAPGNAAHSPKSGPALRVPLQQKTARTARQTPETTVPPNSGIGEGANLLQSSNSRRQPKEHATPILPTKRRSQRYHCKDRSRCHSSRTVLADTILV
jgi:hypothetical protein